MRTVTFQSVLHFVAYKLGLDPSSDGNFTRDLAASLTAYLNFWVREAWERDAWPEWTPVEQRWYRPFFDIGTTYQVGDEVYHEDSDAYYQCIIGPVVGEIPGQSAFWQVLDSGNQEEDPIDRLDQYILLDQPGLTPIGTVLRVTRDDPRQYRGTPRIDVSFSPNGIQVPRRDCAGTSVWVQFRLRPPVFTSAEYDAATDYALGARVYYPTTGECYEAILNPPAATAPTNSTYWRKIDFPYVLAGYAQKRAYAETLEEDGQHDKAAAQIDAAEELLATEWGKAESQQGVIRTTRVLVRAA